MSETKCAWDVEFTSATKATAKDGATLYLFEPCQAVSGGLIFAPDGTVKRIPEEDGEVRSVLLEVVKHVDLVVSFCGARGGCVAIEQVEFPPICVSDVCVVALGNAVHVLTKTQYLGVAPKASLNGTPCAEAVLAAIDELQKYVRGTVEKWGSTEAKLLKVAELARPRIAEVYI